MADRSKATVATGHPVTTDAARTVLEAGGNAFDAVVAAGFAAAVAEPMLTSLAGGGFCLTRTPAGDARLVDFFVDVPGRGRAGDIAALGERMIGVDVRFTATTQHFEVGWASVATPGCLDGWLHVHDDLGRLPLADVVAPAIDAARDGVVVNDQQAYLYRILAPTNRTDPVTAARFVPEDTPLGVGARFVQPELADFLTALGDDPDAAVDAFRSAFVQACGVGGGAVTRADLEAHRTVDRAPLAARYRDVAVLTNPAPSEGGRLVAAQLAALDGLAREDDELALVRIVDAQLVADRLRSPTSTQGTTHISVADADGNVASMTTSNGSGSGCTVPGFGVLANNMLGEDDLFPHGLDGAEPGARISSMMSPTLVLEGDDVVLALGSGGSKRIRTAIAQVVAAFVDGDRDLDAVVAAPRVHWDGEVAQVEPGPTEAQVAALRSRHRVHVWDDLDLYFGGVHAVRPGLDAAGDPRRGGTVAVF